MNVHNRFNFWQKWLTNVNILSVLLGLIVAFWSDSFIFDAYNNYTKEVFLFTNDFDPSILKLKNWLFGIIGGMVVGFHVLVIMISENSVKHKEPWAYKAIWYGLLSWFFIDSAISFYYGAIHNIILINLFTLILIGLPLIMTREDFNKKKQ